MDIVLATEVFETFWNHFLDFLGIGVNVHSGFRLDQIAKSAQAIQLLWPWKSWEDRAELQDLQFFTLGDPEIHQSSTFDGPLI